MTKYRVIRESNPGQGTIFIVQQSKSLFSGWVSVEKSSCQTSLEDAIRVAKWYRAVDDAIKSRYGSKKEVVFKT